ncbi:FAD-binding oxidoreductase [Actinacidiphila paucisporea]|uniref:FAD/FMN-containing dehydrogenase n=1 Tax=Actinacidiphila paucisporea TaxID=310782 RepID=A0A1M7PA54_9ACTN|nr:FAD-binding oxidoreductase [Actinacidiphila paucisporea]SHN13637.1 FAD/FMN-containing dehydrogenase [Actinacidiphila paucisporea]
MDVPAPRPLSPTRVRRRTALTAGGGALAAAWLTGCGPGGGGGNSGGDGKAPSPRTATAAPSRTPDPAFSPVAPDWRALGAALHGRLVRPQDAAYATDRRLYNTRFDHLRPAAIAYVDDADDIRRCLDFAHRTATVPVIRSGGHSYAGWSSGDGKLVIDVSRLATIRMDGTTATVGAGAKLIDVYSTLGGHGRTIPAGSCPSVGVSGLTLGGGHGVMSRSMGLTCDNLIGATLITADGTTHEVSADHEPDIFWALRGAGCGNFGVVTSLRFATHPVPQVVTGYLTWPWSRAADVIAGWQGWGPDQPDHLWSALHLDCAPGGSPTVSVPMLSTGSRADLSAAAGRLADAAGAPASSVSLHPHSYLEATFSYAGCAGLSAAQCHLAPAGRLRRETYTARSDFYDANLPSAGISALLAQVERLASASGGGAGSIALTALGGAVNRVSPTATAFSHRGSRFLAQYLASDALSTTSWLDTTHSAMRRYASGGAYQNYTDPALTDWRTAYYGQNAGRLASLKHTLDPQRLFDFPQAL